MQLDLELYREQVEVEPGVTLSYIDVSPERPLRTFLLIHGFGGNARQWQYQIDAFAGQHRLIAPDLRGHGRSSRPANGYDMPRMVADLAELLAHLGIHRKIVVVGHSYGVALATEFAWRYPEAVSHLVLIAGAGEYRIAAGFRIVFHMPQAMLRLLQPIVHNFIDVDASLRALKQMYQHNLRTWRGWDRFPALKPPTLVILGNRDRVLPRSAFERVGQLVPAETSEVISVDVSAHMVMLERRDAVNRAIARFVEAGTDGAPQARWRERFDLDSRGSLLRERPWLANYETEVPATLHLPRVPLTRLLDRAARRFPRQTAIVFYGRRLSYRRVRDEALRFAQTLHALDVEPGARVLLLLPNVPQMVIAFYGTLYAGAIAVPANPQASPDELRAIVAATEAAVIVTLAQQWKTVNALLGAATAERPVLVGRLHDYAPWHRRLRVLLRGQRVPLPPTALRWTALLHRQKPDPLPLEPQVKATAVIQYTSSSEGEPKGAMLSHLNLMANALQLRIWTTQARDGAESVLCVVPFSHVYGMTAAMNVAITQAATMILLPRFDVMEVLETVRRYRPTYFPAVPAVYVAINNAPDVRRYGLENVRVCISGAAPLPVEVEEKFEKLTRAKLVEGYGLSEASPVTHVVPIHGVDKVGSIGLPLPSTEARIVDLQTGRPLPHGQVGELLVRGPQVMQGYWRDAAATQAAIDAHGWLRTGDIARMDADGYFQIISRRQEMWQAEGARPIYPRDVEEVIYELPEVNEVIVAAVANQPIAFVRLKKSANVSAATIIAYCQRRLPPEQVPRLVIFVTEFPRNLLGKVLRRELVAQYEQRVGAQAGAEAGTVGAHLPGLGDQR